MSMLLAGLLQSQHIIGNNHLRVKPYMLKQVKTSVQTESSVKTFYGSKDKKRTERLLKSLSI